MTAKKNGPRCGQQRGAEYESTSTHSNRIAAPSKPPREAIYALPAYVVSTKGVPPKIRRRADALFSRIEAQSKFKPYKASEKKRFWRHVFRSAHRSVYERSAIRVELHASKTSKAKRQVLDCAEEAGLLHKFPGSHGDKRCAIYMPTAELEAYIDARSPKTFERKQEPENFVSLYTRKSKKRLGRRVVVTSPKPLEFDPLHPVAAETQRKLQCICRVNAEHKVTCLRWCPIERQYVGERHLDTTLVARFSDGFTKHGRMYTSGIGGYQQIRERERQTVLIDGASCIELDFGGMHPRMLYHLHGLECPLDPYALWGPTTTTSQRLPAKLMVNAIINAHKSQGAIHTCREAISLRTKTGAWKRGNAYEDAEAAGRAWRECGCISFDKLYRMAVEFHRPIAHLFHNDWGMTLMRHDSAIAIDVAYYFAERGIPCLCYHDSFLVPAEYEKELCRLMIELYRRRFRFDPVTKRKASVYEMGTRPVGRFRTWITPSNN